MRVRQSKLDHLPRFFGVNIFRIFELLPPRLGKDQKNKSESRHGGPVENSLYSWGNGDPKMNFEKLVEMGIMGIC